MHHCCFLEWKTTGELCMGTGRTLRPSAPTCKSKKRKGPSPPCCLSRFWGAELQFLGAEGALPWQNCHRFSVPMPTAALWWTLLWNGFYWVPWHEGIRCTLILAGALSPVPGGVSCPHWLMHLCLKIILSLRHQLIYFNSTSNLCLVSFHIQVSHLTLMNCNCF